MTTQWTITIDWNRDGDFTDTYDNITDRVINANWFLGMDEAYMDAADASSLTLTLNNSDRRYSPEYAASPLSGSLVPFRPVRIQSDDGTTVRTHWVGWVETIQPAVNQYGERTAQIVATGAMQFLKAAETSLELQENKCTDEIIAALIKEVVFPPSLSRAGVIGRVGNAELGQTTYLADTTAYSDLETGKTTLEMAGDNWVRQGGLSDVEQDTFNVYHAIRDVTAAERGRFFFDRTGKAIFWNRHHLLDEDTSTATIDDTMTDMAYTFAGLESLKNEVIVTCHPRSVSTSANDVLWELDGAVVQVAAGETRTLYVKYKDEDGNRIGGKDVTVSGTEFAEGNASVTVEPKANGAELKLVNSGAGDAVMTACQVKGRKITDFGQMDAKSIDGNSIVDYGRRTMKVNLPSVDNLAAAQSIADFEQLRRKDPRGAVSSVTMLSHGQRGGGNHTNQLALTIGDLITIQETQTDHDAAYAIIGEAHELTNGAARFKTTWYLEPVPEQYPGKIGDVDRAKLGQTTYITY
jgi:hypothetical protein